MGQNPVAIVTGATGGIGYAIASLLHQQGYDLVLHGYASLDRGAELEQEFAGSLYIDGDLSAPQVASELVAKAAETFGRIDLLVNNAGIGIPHPHADIAGVTPDFFHSMLNTNLVAPWLLIQAAAPHLKTAQGSIINMSSMAASTVSGSSIPYAVSKAGLEHLTKLLAVAMGPEVRVNAIAPGLVDTPRTSQWTEIRAAVEESAPLRRSATPEDIALACAALIATPYVTGAVLPVDGGQRLV